MKKKAFFLTILTLFSGAVLSANAYTPPKRNLDNSNTASRAGRSSQSTARRGRVRIGNGIVTAAPVSSTTVTVGSTGGVTSATSGVVVEEATVSQSLSLYECSKEYTSCLEKPGICDYGLKNCKKYLVSSVGSITADDITTTDNGSTYTVITTNPHNLYAGLEIRMTDAAGSSVVTKVSAATSALQFTVTNPDVTVDLAGYTTISLISSSVLASSFASEKGVYCEDVITNQCAADITASDVYPYVTQQMEQEFFITDYASCRNEYTRCVKDPQVCGSDYTGCVDFLVTDTRNATSASGVHTCSVRKLTCEVDEMQSCYDTCTQTNAIERAECITECQETTEAITTICKTKYKACLQEEGGAIAGYSSMSDSDTTSFYSAFQERVRSCDDEVFTRCKLSAQEQLDIETYALNDYLRNVDQALVTYNETHGKIKWTQALDCVDKVDECMKQHCGEDYKNCLTTTGQPDEITLNNFKSYCQRDLVSCSELRVSAGMQGYQFLANPDVDGVSQVWDDFVENKMLAHGAKVEVERRELDRELEVLISRANKKCNDLGGQFTYERMELEVFSKKYGDSHTTADNLGGSVLHGTNTKALKEDNFYEKAVCQFPVEMRRSNVVQGESKMFGFGDKFTCDEATFGVGPKVSDRKNSEAWGTVIGAVVGAAGGGFAGKKLQGDNGLWKGKNGTDDKKAGGKWVGAAAGGVVAGTLGGLAGNAIGKSNDDKKEKEALKEESKNWACFTGSHKLADFAGEYQVNTPQEFIDLDEFYTKNPELVVQRGEFSNGSNTSNKSSSNGDFF